MLKPKALKSGARLAVLSPASAAKQELVAAGIERLRGLGYDPVLSPNALARGPLYYAGTVAERVSDLHAAFADESIDGILCTRGGWGSAELLPHLDADLIRANPKPFIGYSDHTSLHIWLQRFAGLVTFHGPMCAADFSHKESQDPASWRDALEGSANWSLGASDGLRVLNPGIAEGELTGGCLSIFVESLATPYAAMPSGGILFLEDIGTKPYQWDRQLLHLRYSGHLERATGIVLGDMTQCVPPEDQVLLEQAVLHALRDFPGPVAIGLRSGHVAAGNITLPLGVRARLDLTAEPRMEFLEAAVVA
jgi:muramoyltetrapeptide carboxypeptidase